VDSTSLSRPRRARKARTLDGKFGAARLRYFRGELAPEEEQSFERLCLLLDRLHKQMREEA
jgi:hypothetical protein